MADRLQPFLSIQTLSISKHRPPSDRHRLPVPRLGFVLLALLLWAALSLSNESVTYAEDDPSKPKRNIVLILSDDQAWGDYGFMGHPHIKTPHLDRLARSSTLFRRGYVPTALCRPSLMTILTGHYASVHGVTGNDPSPAKVDPKSEAYAQQRQKLISRIQQFDALPKRLQQAGYRCLQTGKFWEGNYKNGGFTDGMTRGFPQKGGRHGDDGLKIGRKTMKPIDDFLADVHESDEPFFIWYAPMLPHTPHNPPAKFANSQTTTVAPTVARYYAMCEWFDDSCGQLMGLLEKYGETENTLVVYVCDNGWIQDPKSRKFALRSKQSPFEGGIRTPIFFYQPGVIPNADRPELATSLDLYPTMLAAAGLSADSDRPGLNLWPSLTAGKPIERERIFGQAFAHDIADLDDPLASLLFRWCIEGNYKLLLTDDGETNRYGHVNRRDDPSPQLYDLSKDPDETTNLATEMPELVEQMTKQINDWYASR